jgi:hypothetical protein
MPGSCRPLWIASLALAPWLACAQVGGSPPPRTEIEVVVTDTANAAIAQAEVNWTCEYRPRGGRSVSTPKRTSATDFNGKLTMPLPTEGYCRVAVRQDGYVDADDPMRVEHLETVRVEINKTARLAVQLLKAASLEGTVFLEDGRRVSQAIVRLQPAALATGPVRLAGPSWLVERTAKDGHYRFPVVPPGDYGMWISPPEALVRASLKQGSNGEWTGYAGTLWHPSIEEVQNIVPVTLDPGQELRGVDPVLRPVKVVPLKGVLYDQLTRMPLTRATVGLRVAGAAPVEVLAARPVDEKTGAFEFPPLPEQEYDLLVYRDGPGMNLPWPVRISLGGAPLQKARIFVPGPDPVEASWMQLGHAKGAGVGVLVPGWTSWSGWLAFQDSPKRDPASAPDPYSQPLTEVRLLPLDLPEFAPVIASFDPSRPRIDDDGLRRTFDLQTPPLPPGSYELQVVTAEGWFLASVTTGGADVLKQENAADGILITPSTDLEIDVQRGGAAVEGLVVNARGEPVPNSTVCAVSDQPWRLRQPGGAFCVRAESDGKYRSRWLSPGPWRLWAFPKRPLERPGSEAFETRYGRAARALEMPPQGGFLRVTLLCAE